MIRYWYVSMSNNYPENDVECVQMKRVFSIVEMMREAEPKEIDCCKLIYIGRGRWKDDHIQKNLSKYL